MLYKATTVIVPRLSWASARLVGLIEMSTYYLPNIFVGMRMADHLDACNILRRILEQLAGKNNKHNFCILSAHHQRHYVLQLQLPNKHGTCEAHS